MRGEMRRCYRLDDIAANGLETVVENVAYAGGLVPGRALGLAGVSLSSLFSTSPRANGRSYAATLRRT